MQSEALNCSTPFTLGLCGGMGSGKTLVSELLQIAGFAIYNSDQRAKWLNDHSPSIRSALIKNFGEDVYLGKDLPLNRAVLAEKIFSDPAALALVNSIIHPEVEQDFIDWRQKQAKSYVLLESAILYSSGFDRLCDKVLRVDAPLEIRLRRLEQRDQSSRAQLLKRIESQAKEEKLAQQACLSIANYSPHMLLPQLAGILAKIGFDINNPPL